MRNLKWFSLLLVIFSNTVKGFDNQKLSQCKIKLLSIYKGEGESYLDYEVTLKTIDGNERKAVDITFDLDETVDEDYTVSIKIDKSVDGRWQENVYNYEGSLCVPLLKYFPKVWTNFKKACRPQIEAECEVKSGHYEIFDFEEDPEDFDVPAAMFGMFKMTTELLDPEEEVAACVIIEFEIKR